MTECVFCECPFESDGVINIAISIPSTQKVIQSFTVCHKCMSRVILEAVGMFHQGGD